MKAFIYNGEVYIRAVPGKTLFHSTMVHEVVNRGDIFAVRCSDQQLTIVPGKAEVEHIELTSPELAARPAPPSLKQVREEIRAKIAAGLFKAQQGEIVL